jgi:cupin fold WbuC family metalloprotein
MKLINTTTINELLNRAAASARRRSNYNIHESAQDPIQRYLVAAKRDSYFRPHRHRSTSELAFVLRGRFDLIVFDDAGRVTDRISLGCELETMGFEMPPDVWHSWIPMIDDSIFLEVKEGPYDPASAVEFAEWSPREGDDRVADFLSNMRGLVVGDRAMMRCMRRSFRKRRTHSALSPARTREPDIPTKKDAVMNPDSVFNLSLLVSLPYSPSNSVRANT